jgi:hypothetical protein
MINLLPEETRIERFYGRKNRVLVGYVAALLVTAGLVATVMMGSLRLFGTNESALLEEIAQNKIMISNLQEKTSEVNKTVTRLNTVNKLYESGISFSELVPSIGGLLPRGSVLNALSLTGESTDTLNLDVDLERPELAAVLVRNLVESDIFEAADIGAINPKGGVDERYPYGTIVRVSFTGTAEAKRKVEAANKAEAARRTKESSAAQ